MLLNGLVLAEANSALAFIRGAILDTQRDLQGAALVCELPDETLIEDAYCFRFTGFTVPALIRAYVELNVEVAANVTGSGVRLSVIEDWTEVYGFERKLYRIGDQQLTVLIMDGTQPLLSFYILQQ